MRRIARALAAACAALAALPARAELPVWSVAVVRVYPHDRGAFTEGLLYRDGTIFESTGEIGRSEIRQVRLEDGRVIRAAKLPRGLFGEGLVDWRHELLSVTWRSGIGFRWSARDLSRRASFRYPGEGWGLTRNGHALILSDGTPTLRFLDPETFAERRRISVTAEGRPLRKLNELEWVDGEIYANVWETPLVARIDPADGRVKGWIDLRALPEAAVQEGTDAVANGIAWDAAGRRLFVTGKNWPSLYEIRLVKPR